MNLRESLNLVQHMNLIERIIGSSLLFELEFDPNKFLNRIQSTANLARRPATPGEGEAAKHAFNMLKKRAETELAKEVEKYPQQDKSLAKERARAEATQSRVLKQIEDIEKWMNSPDTSNSIPGGNKPNNPSRNPPKREFTVGVWLYDSLTKLVGKVVSYDTANTTEPNYIVQLPNRELHKWRAASVRRATQEEIDAALAKKDGADTGQSSDDWSIVSFAVFQEGTSNKCYGIAKKGKRYITFWGRRNGPYRIKDHSPRDAEAQFYSKIDKGYRRYVNTQTIADALEILKRSLANNNS